MLKNRFDCEKGVRIKKKGRKTKIEISKKLKNVKVCEIQSILYIEILITKSVILVCWNFI